MFTFDELSSAQSAKRAMVYYTTRDPLAARADSTACASIHTRISENGSRTSEGLLEFVLAFIFLGTLIHLTSVIFTLVFHV